MNQDGSNQTQITNHAGEDLRGDFNSDSSKIVYQSSRSGNPDIWITPYN